MSNLYVDKLALEEKYPIDNNPLFPGKRFYTDSKNRLALESRRFEVECLGYHCVGEKFGI
jgi:hypothetical protein